MRPCQAYAYLHELHGENILKNRKELFATRTLTIAVRKTKVMLAVGYCNLIAKVDAVCNLDCHRIDNVSHGDIMHLVCVNARRGIGIFFGYFQGGEP